MMSARRLQALWWRERASLFGTPLAWTVAAVFALAAGLVQWLVGLGPGAPASIAPAGGAIAWCILLLAPALSVRSATEDKRSGFGEVLVAGPARSEEVALARFLGAMAAIVLAIGAGLLGPALAVGHFARLDWGELFTSAIGLLAIGGALVATGLLVGTVSRSAPVASFIASVVWLVLVVCGQVLPEVLGPRFAEAAFAVDPMRRVARALGGVLDVGDIIAFLGVIAGLLLACSIVLQSQRTAASLDVAGRARTLLALVACMVGALAIGDAAGDPRVGPSIAMARGPAAPLAPDTTQAIRETPDAVVTLVAPASAALPAVEDLLHRLSEAGVVARRFDPDALDDPAYAAWLDELASHDAPAVAGHDAAIEAGLDAAEALAAESAEVVPALAECAGTDAARARALGAAWAQFAEQWGEVRRSIADQARPSAAQPFGDRTAAAAQLRDSLAAWADRVALCAQALGATQNPRARSAAAVCSGLHTRLRDAAATLRGLPALRHGALTRALTGGSAFVVQRGESLLARPGWMVAGEGLDARSRAESIFLDALRLPSGADVPIAVLVHAEPRSLLRPVSSGADLSALHDALAAARFEVREWAVASGEEPALPRGRPRVYWIIPPLARQGIDPAPAERALVAAAGRLVDNGESIVLSLAPSLLAVAGQQDAWAQLAARLGVDARTDRLWLEAVAVDEGKVERRSDVVIHRAELAHPIGGAVDGLPVHFPSAVPLRARLESVGAIALLQLPSGESILVSRDWRGARQRSGRDDEAVTAEDAAVLAIEPSEGQRAVVVACPDWMLSAVARRPAAGDARRAMLAAPGNLALAVAASSWATGGRPAGFAAGAQAERLSRIPPLTAAENVASAIGMVGLLPLGLALAGWSIDRRRRHA